MFVCSQHHVQVVVAGVVVTKALFWTDIVTVFGLLATDLGPGCYDHFNYDHLDVVPMFPRNNTAHNNNYDTKQYHINNKQQ